MRPIKVRDGSIEHCAIIRYSLRLRERAGRNVSHGSLCTSAIPIQQGACNRRMAALELWPVDDANASIEVDAQRQKQTRRNMSDGLGQCRMGSAVGLSPEEGKERYFSEVLIESNLVLRFEPRPFTTAMIASEIPAAIRPYSMAVAPDSSDKNLRKIRCKSASC